MKFFASLAERSIVFATQSVHLSGSMQVDRNLKRLLLVAASAVSFGVTAFPATAQSRTKTCFYLYETQVLRVDTNTIICRNPNHTAVDNLTLYRYCNRGDQVLMSNVVLLRVNANNKKG